MIDPVFTQEEVKAEDVEDLPGLISEEQNAQFGVSRLSIFILFQFMYLFFLSFLPINLIGFFIPCC